MRFSLRISRDNKLFGLAELLAFAENSAVWSFFILYLKLEGYKGSQIGIITSLTMVACLVAQPFAGFLADNVFDIRKIIAFNLIVSIFAIGAIYFFHSNFWIVFGCFFLFSITARYVPALMDIYITKMSMFRSGLDFGFVRGLGSLGYATTALLVGMIISSFGYEMMFISHTVFAVGTVVVIMFMPKPKKFIKNKKAKGESFFKQVSELCKNKKFIFSIFAIFVVFCGTNGFGSYLPLYIDEIGGTATHYGLAVFVMAVAEIPVMWNFNSFRRKFTIEKILTFSLIMSIVRITLPILFKNIYLVVFLQALQAFSSGFFVPAIVFFIQKMLPENKLSVGFLFAASIYSAGSVIVSNLLGGFLIDNYGMMACFYVCIAFSVVGAILFMFAMRLKDTPQPALE